MPTQIDTYIDAALETRGVERPVLRALRNQVESTTGSVVLAGLTDYSKHLVNLFPERIIAIWDEDPDLKGISFRGVPVVSALPPQATHVIGTRFEDLYRAQTSVLTELGGAATFTYPKQMEGRHTRDLITHIQTPFYQQLLRDVETAESASSSMMSFDKIVFLVELLRSTIHAEGDVAEIGVWQGGSAYYLALAMAQLESSKNLYLLDFFEQLDPNQPKGIMCNDQILRQFEFYPHTELVEGDIRQTVESLKDRPLCFVHYDMGYQPAIVDVIAHSLSPGGIILLDNYGHLAGKPGMFDAHFSRLGFHVVRVPYTDQALVIRAT